MTYFCCLLNVPRGLPVAVNVFVYTMFFGDIKQVFMKPAYRDKILTLSTLGKIFSRRHFEIFFLFFSENRI